jgi:predicted phage tail protein
MARKIGWILAALGAVAVVATFIASSDVTVRFTAGMAYGVGLVILGVSMLIITTPHGPGGRKAS